MLNAEVGHARISAVASPLRHSTFSIQHQHSALQMSSQRPSRVGEQIREDLTELLAREVHDPGVGFLTITRVEVTSDLQSARIYYTTLGDAQAPKQSARALERATPFLRRQLGRRLRLRRIPELHFFFDENIERLDRVERILQELQTERAGRTEASAETSRDDDASNTHNEPDDDR
jgi:ribosome-binding factor A